MTNFEHTDPVAGLEEELALAEADERGAGGENVGAPLVFLLLAGLGMVLAVLSPVTVVRLAGAAVVAVAGGIAFRLLTRRGGGSR